VTHAGARTKVYSASFSPDGTAITLGMTGVNGQADVYTIGIDGTGLTPVTRSPAWDSAPDWGGTG
jgi:Tol biopolymer transport system component